MRRSSGSPSALRHSRLVALALLIGVSVLTACAPEGPLPRHPSPTAQPSNFSEPKQEQEPRPEILPTIQDSVDRDSNRKPAESAFVVGSSKGKTYHRPSCEWAMKIRHSNLIQFKDAEDAAKRGYAPCRTCRPR